MFIAHLLGDFLLQSNSWVKQRQEQKLRAWSFYIHIIIHGFLTYLFIANWSNITIPLLIMVIHFIIDLVKIYKLKALRGFIIDQFLHILSILILWWRFISTYEINWSYFQNLNVSFYIITCCYILVIWPVAIFIKQLTQHWGIGEEEGGSGETTGKWIGVIERILILTFILIGQFGAIGFLIAAKSVFRVKDIRDKEDQRKSEYILVGSFLSFAIAVILGVLMIQVTG